MITTILLSFSGFAAEQLPAHEAVDTAALRWAPAEGELIRYRFTSSLRLDASRVDLTPMQGLSNALAVNSTFDLNCVPYADSKGLLLNCNVSDATLESADPSPEVAGRIRDGQMSMTGAKVDVLLTRAGRILETDVRWTDGIALDHSPLVREVIENAVAGLDLELPGAGIRSWTQNRSALLPAPMPGGPLARLELEHSLSATLGIARVDTTGEIAWFDPGGVVSSEGRIRGRVDAVAHFDPNEGVLLRRDWRTRSNILPFVQIATVELLSPENI